MASFILTIAIGREQERAGQLPQDIPDSIQCIGVDYAVQNAKRVSWERMQKKVNKICPSDSTMSLDTLLAKFEKWVSRATSQDQPLCRLSTALTLPALPALPAASAALAAPPPPAAFAAPPATTALAATAARAAPSACGACGASGLPGGEAALPILALPSDVMLKFAADLVESVSAALSEVIKEALKRERGEHCGDLEGLAAQKYLEELWRQGRLGKLENRCIEELKRDELIRDRAVHSLLQESRDEVMELAVARMTEQPREDVCELLLAHCDEEAIVEAARAIKKRRRGIEV